jgi:hypothetical protein
MAGRNIQAVTSEIALTAATAKTAIQLVPATNIGVRLNALEITFDGISTTDPAAVCVLMRQSTAGTMSSLTLVERNTNDPGAIQMTAQHTATVEPTSSDVLHRWDIHPQGGKTIYFNKALGNELIMYSGERYGLVITAPNAVNVIVSCDLEE